DPRVKPCPEVGWVRANEDARHPRVIEEKLDQCAQTFLVHFFAKEYPDGQTLGERTGWHRSVILPPTVDKDAIHSAARLQVRLPGGLTMDHRQIVGESGNGLHRHAVRDENYGHATLSGRQVECDAVRVTVI